MQYISGISSMLGKIEKQYGPEASESAATAYCDCAVNSFIITASSNSNERTIMDLIQLLWEPLKNFGFNFTIEEHEDGTQVTCTRCPWAIMFKTLGAEKWGYVLQCAADRTLVERFNPEIGFKRSKTLMEGDDCCDHFYYKK